MSTLFKWLDTSQRDRRRALDVIDLLSIQETRDELGIGSIRDALADQLAPGLSTIQTRARYFMFVPWAYQVLRKRAVRGAEVASALRKLELDLRDALAASDDTDGTVGIRAGRAVQRLPSSIYWHGLEVLGIRRLSGSMDALERKWSRSEAPARAGGDREESVRPAPVWDLHLPAVPPQFPAGATFALAQEEASYLRERFRQRAPDSLVTFLIEQGASRSTEALPWLHPGTAGARGHLASHIEHARCFSDVMHGAALLYNLMLAQMLRHEEWSEDYDGMFTSWAEALARRIHALHAWDRPAFWALVYQANPRVAGAARKFVEDWATLVLGARSLPGLAASASARELIRARELALKKGRARLHVRQYLELWSGSAGSDALDYRWRTVQAMVRDIVDGLEGGAEGA